MSAEINMKTATFCEKGNCKNISTKKDFQQQKILFQA